MRSRGAYLSGPRSSRPRSFAQSKRRTGLGLGFCLHREFPSSRRENGDVPLMKLEEQVGPGPIDRQVADRSAVAGRCSSRPSASARVKLAMSAAAVVKASSSRIINKAAGTAEATITSTLRRTSSPAKMGNRSTFPSAHRYSSPPAAPRCRAARRARTLRPPARGGNRLPI